MSEQMRSRMGLASVVSLLIANVVVPLIGGDLYPFTSAPMFREEGDRCGAVPQEADWWHIRWQFPRDGNQQYAYVEVEQDVLARG